MKKKLKQEKAKSLRSLLKLVMNSPQLAEKIFAVKKVPFPPLDSPVASINATLLKAEKARKRKLSCGKTPLTHHSSKKKVEGTRTSLPLTLKPCLSLGGSSPVTLSLRISFDIGILRDLLKLSASSPTLTAECVVVITSLAPKQVGSVVMLLPPVPARTSKQ